MPRPLPVYSQAGRVGPSAQGQLMHITGLQKNVLKAECCKLLQAGVLPVADEQISLLVIPLACHIRG